MRPIRELLDDATCEAIDRWRAEATPGVSHDVHVSVNGKDTYYPVSMWLHVMDGTVALGFADSYGETFARAWEIAHARINGAALDCWGNATTPAPPPPTECSGPGIASCASDSQSPAATEAAE